MTGVLTLENELRHARTYDPAKAHEYYLRTRHLRGRGRASAERPSSPGGNNGTQGGTRDGGMSGNAVLRDSRREELEASIERMRAQVDQLRALLRKRVDAAKKRAGVETPDKETSTSSTTKDKKASESSTKDSKSKPLTEKQKADKRKASKEQYEKENGTSLAREAEALRNTITTLRERLAKLQKPANQEQDQPNGGNGR